ncbi:hypothetical protein SUDANB43_04119 [Streptomyces sp. enrichment culture]
MRAATDIGAGLWTIRWLWTTKAAEAVTSRSAVWFPPPL